MGKIKDNTFERFKVGVIIWFIATQKEKKLIETEFLISF